MRIVSTQSLDARAAGPQPARVIGWLVSLPDGLRPGLRAARFGAAVLLAAAAVRAQTDGSIYVWSTLAGSAGGNRLGATDGIGTDARFNWPFGVAVDGGGNVFVADSYNNAIRKITSARVVTTLVGAAAGVLNTPEGIAVDRAGNLFVADTFNQVVRKITSAGVVSIVAGQLGVAGFADGVGILARFNYPRRIAVDAAGNLYVADTLNHIIRKIDGAGTVTTIAGSPTSPGSNDGADGSARLNQPWGVAAGADGKLYVADYGNATVRKLTPQLDGTYAVTTLAGAAGQTGATDGPGSTARFFQPAGIAVDGAGNVFVADTFNQTIRRITAVGIVTTIGGKAGQRGALDGLTGTATFSAPYGIAVDAAGTLYVADQENSTIRAGALPVPPVIGAQPQSVTVTAGVGAAFNVIATGQTGVTYQWLLDGKPIAGATAAILTISAAQAKDAGRYSVVVTSLGGSTTSAEAALTVIAPPAIVVAPQGAVIGVGGTTTLSVGAAGSGPLTFQWQRDGVPLAGATSPALATSVPGNYTVVVTNSFGSTTSAAARVEFPNRLINLSTRGTVGPDTGTLLAGFVVVGAANTKKSLLIRGVGPTLASFGVDGAVAQTALSVRDGKGAIVAANQGWLGNSNVDQIVSVTRAVGAFPLPLTANSSVVGDSAVLVNVAPGSYTVTLAPPAGVPPGAGLIEVYETSGDDVRLVNLSTRGQVSTGASLMAGLVVQGTASATLLVRAIGPGLTQFGVTGALAKPQLSFIGTSGVLATNTGWSTGGNPASVAAAATATGAFPLAANSDDSALLITVQRGAYTAQVTGAGGASGVALVEVYQVP